MSSSEGNLYFFKIIAHTLVATFFHPNLSMQEMQMPARATFTRCAWIPATSVTRASPRTEAAVCSARTRTRCCFRLQLLFCDLSIQDATKKQWAGLEWMPQIRGTVAVGPCPEMRRLKMSKIGWPRLQQPILLGILHQQQGRQTACGASHCPPPSWLLRTTHRVSCKKKIDALPCEERVFSFVHFIFF